MSYSRIVVYGAPGSGKTFLATKLSAILSIPKYSIDDYFWKKSWQESSKEELKEKILPILKQEKWILDGNYSEIRPYALEKAELAIILKIPAIQCILNIFIRTLFRNLKIKSKSITPLPKEIKEKDVGLKNFLPAFFILSKMSIKFNRQKFKEICQELKKSKITKIIVIKSRKELNIFTKSLLPKKEF
ncbi:MAG: hypothetical protein K9W46_12350 [Candidatus Heimdallarchaeum endolithica]|uniref:Topology modulation protein n=1 Tax=Candidatus Heimdallarchaeum endolithica TaxID=2876572 RepID=A0A9Y1FNH9_9ARCH|nr:MAG: hypothetical protein K9W46_12350 [Candidatus Heimdallarchaeum endolithica]